MKTTDREQKQEMYDLAMSVPATPATRGERVLIVLRRICGYLFAASLGLFFCVGLIAIAWLLHDMGFKM